MELSTLACTQCLFVCKSVVCIDRGELSWLRVVPAYKISQSRDQVLYEDSLRLESIKQVDMYLNITSTNKNEILTRVKDISIETIFKMKSVDTDGDGVVSRAAFIAAGFDSSRFDELDADGNGFLDTDELKEAVLAFEEQKLTLVHSDSLELSYHLAQDIAKPRVEDRKTNVKAKVNISTKKKKHTAKVVETIGAASSMMNAADG